MGWILKKLFTVLKGPWAMAFKERWEAGGAIRGVKNEEKSANVKIPDDVLKNHDITKGLKDQKHFVGYGAKVTEKTELLAQNVLFEVEDALKEAGECEKRIEDISTRHQKNGKAMEAITSFEGKLDKSIMGIEKDERGLLLRRLLPVMAYAEKGKGTDPTAMAKLEQVMKVKEDISQLARIAVRKDVAALRRGVKAIQAGNNSLRSKARQKPGSQKAEDQFAFALKQTLDKIIEGITTAFGGAYLLLKRDFLLMLAHLNLLNHEERQVRQFIIDHYMPRAPEEKHEENVESLKAALTLNLRLLRQGFLRIISAEEKLEKLASGQWKLAKREVARTAA